MDSFFVGVGFGLLCGTMVGFILFHRRIIFRAHSTNPPGEGKGIAIDTSIESANIEYFTDAANSLEMERQRIGAEIHDELTLPLLTIKVELEKIALEASVVSPIIEHNVAKSCHAISKVALSIRYIVNAMLPQELESGDLARAINNMCRKLNSFKGTKISFETSGDPLFLTDEQKLNVYRIAQELLSNTIKHSLAWLILVSLIWSDDKLKLKVKDDGIGLERGRSQQGGWGLRNIQLRAKVIGAIIRFHTPEQGTEFELTLPLKNNIYR